MNDVERVRETLDRLVRVAPASIVVADYNLGYVALERLESENARLRETLRVREESQIPMIPRAAHERLRRYEKAMVEAQDHLRPSHAAYRILGAALAEGSAE